MRRNIKTAARRWFAVMLCLCMLIPFATTFVSAVEGAGTEYSLASDGFGLKRTLTIDGEEPDKDTVIQNGTKFNLRLEWSLPAGDYNEADTFNIKVDKVWADENDADGIRPDSITVKLLADNVVKETVTVKPDADGQWTHTFTGLDRSKDGKNITYTVKEEAVEGYTTSITGTAAGGFTISVWRNTAGCGPPDLTGG